MKQMNKKAIDFNVVTTEKKEKRKHLNSMRKKENANCFFSFNSTKKWLGHFKWMVKHRKY